MADQLQPEGGTDAAASPLPALEVVDDELVTVTVRRSPKYSVFLVAGAAIGILVALILTFAFSGSEDKSPNTGMIYSQTQVFGFLALIGIVIGVLIGGVTALILDRALSRRTHRVAADREHTRVLD